MTYYKLGDSGDKVKQIQEALGIKADGVFGNKTELAVKYFQLNHNLISDGIVGYVTWTALMGGIDGESTIIDWNYSKLENFYEDYYMTAGNSVKMSDKIVWVPNFYPGPVEKHWMILHHTAGWDNPYQVADIWSKDDKTVGTEWVVGGQHVNNIQTKYDGKILKVMPSGSYAWHLTIGNNNLHRESVGIEICSFGGLTEKNGKYYNYVGTEVHPGQVCDVGYNYRGSRYFHKLSDKQIESVKSILEYEQATNKIDMRKGLPELIKTKGVEYAFNMCDTNYMIKNPGLYTHGNAYAQKNDIFPQKELIDMLLSL
jgi:hypothetical protein